MLGRLSAKVDFPRNAHSFRRGFACHLHKRGLSTLSIMHLGRWSSLDIVSRYTKSITFLMIAWSTTGKLLAKIHPLGEV